MTTGYTGYSRGKSQQLEDRKNKCGTNFVVYTAGRQTFIYSSQSADEHASCPPFAVHTALRLEPSFISLFLSLSLLE